MLTYGIANSIRTDVVLRDGPDGLGEIKAVWDVKTGSATLGQTRLDQIREQLKIGREVPVIELNAMRGVMLKARVVNSRGNLLDARI